MIPTEMGTRPMTEFGTDTPQTDDQGRQLHQLRGLTVVVDGEPVDGSIISTTEQVFPAGAIIAPKGQSVARIRARAESERFATLQVAVTADMWQAVGSVADLLGLTPAGASKGGDK